jgi:hypothetical protein
MKMINEEDLLGKLDRIKVTCDVCFILFDRTKRNINAGRKKHNKDLCASCAAKKSISLKPQCNKEYWTENKRKLLGASIKSSEIYQSGIKLLERSGIHNSMFGKKHSLETKQKMSKSRTGKTGENATAWKGGNNSLNARVKSNDKFWTRDIISRDKICQHCYINKNLDAHHIQPMAKLIKEHLLIFDPIDDNLRYEYLIKQPKIMDINRENGIALCRDCHRKVHLNWGSHSPEV